MKFNEFVALSEHLEENGSSINEFVYDVTGAYLFEADEEIETNRAGKGLHSPRFALKRKKLNNNAKKFLAGAKEKVVDKYSPKILGSTKKLITMAAALKEEGKNPDEINKLLAKEAKSAITQQEKSMGRLDVIIDKVEAVYSKRVEEILKDPKLSEKNKGLLNIYWALLTLQVRQLLDKSLVKYREDMIEEALGNNPEMEKMLKIMSQSPNWKQKMQDYKDSIDGKKKEFKESSEAEEGEEKPVEGEAKAKTAEAFKEDIANEKDKDKLILLAKDAKKSTTLTPEEKKEIGTLLKEKGITEEDMKSKESAEKKKVEPEKKDSGIVDKHGNPIKK